jgi:hypothetical protein
MDSERGAIIVFALAVLGVLSVLTGAWLRLVVAERDTARLDADALQARSLANAGIERALGWFADPASFADSFTVGPPTTCLAALIPPDVFRKRCVGSDGLPGFRASDGAPQFGGTLEDPAVLVQWGDAPSLLRAPAGLSMDAPPLFPVVRLDLRLFSPLSPDAVATVISRATVGRSTASVRAELAEGPWRGAIQAVFAGNVATNTIPVRVHWGGIAINGAWDASGWLDRIPRRSETAPVNGEEYMAEPGSDRWAAIAATGSIIGPAADASGFAAPFAHLHQNTHVPRMGLWGYEALKAYAKRHGRYFTTRGTGLLYPDDGETGVSPTTVLAAHSGSRRFLFIDTMDRTAPRDDNLDVLQSTIDFVSLDAYVGAHLTIIPGHGRSVVLDAPSAPETSAGEPLARDVEIDGVHYHGVLVVAGVLEAETRTRIVGSLAVLQGVRDAGAFEVWYDAALRRTGRDFLQS